jgi:hypothetical protein
LPVILLDNQTILPFVVENQLRYRKMDLVNGSLTISDFSAPITEELLPYLSVDRGKTYRDLGFYSGEPDDAAEQVARHIEARVQRRQPQQQFPTQFQFPPTPFPNIEHSPQTLFPNFQHSPSISFPTVQQTPQTPFPNIPYLPQEFLNPAPVDFNFPPGNNSTAVGEQPIDRMEEEATVKKRKRSVSRGVDNTIARGFRFGVATWNLHGFQKSQELTIQQCLDYETPLKTLAEVDSLRISLAGFLSKNSSPLFKEHRNTLETVTRQLNTHQAVYVRELCTRFKDFTGTDPNQDPEHEAAKIKTAPDLAKAKSSLDKYSARQIPQSRPRKAKPGAAPSKRKKKDKPPKPKPSTIDLAFNAAKGALLKRTATAALKKMFDMHLWLDAVVLQEVKYTGIGVLEHLAAENGFEIYRGPRMQGVSEVEFYPLALRKDCFSYNNLGQKLKVKRIWWINPDGTIGQLADVSAKDNTNKADVRWNKESDSYRPVIIYDIEIGEGSEIVVHLGVTHTTPSQERSKLTAEEQRSVQMVMAETNKRSAKRQGQLASTEFQRLNQFKQLEVALGKISTNAYADRDGADDQFSGPWILAGDYYLFRESRVKDLSTLFQSDLQAFQQPYQERLMAEFNQRLEIFNACAKNRMKYSSRAQHCLVMRQSLENVADPERNALQQQILMELHKDNLFLANECTSAEAGLRSVIWSHRHTWLTPAHVVAGLNSGQFDRKDGETILDSKSRVMLYVHRSGLENVLDARHKMYSALRSHCARCEQRKAELQAVDQTNPLKVLGALRAQNDRLMKQSLTPLPEPKEGEKKKSGKTIQNLAYNAYDDPMRNTAGLTFQSLIDDNLEITQAVSGSNSNKFERLALLKFTGPDYRKEFQYHATRLKVADFFINTRYDASRKHGVNHWTEKCVGLMSPFEGRMMLADTEDLALSRYWAAVSDHFPIGAFYSTDQGIGEDSYLRNQVLTTLKEETIEESNRQIRLLDRQRRLDRLADLRMLAMLKRAMDPVMMMLSPAALAVQAAERDTTGLDNRQLDDLIEDIEEYLDVPDDDRFGQITLDLADFDVKDEA